MQPPSKDYELPEGAIEDASWSSAAHIRGILKAALSRYPVLGLDEEELRLAIDGIKRMEPSRDLDLCLDTEAKLQQTLEALKKEKGCPDHSLSQYDREAQS